MFSHKWFMKFLARVDDIYFVSLSGLSSFKIQVLKQIHVIWIVLDDFIEIHGTHVMCIYAYASICKRIHTSCRVLKICVLVRENAQGSII